MLSKFAEATPRNFSPKLTPELSDEARKAVNAAFEAMSTWRTETVDSFEIVIDKMAAAARALGWPQPIVDATHAQMQGVIKNADPNDGSNDGRLGGTDQITEFVIGDTIEAAVHLQLWPGGRLAQRRRSANGSIQPIRDVYANGTTVAKNMGGRDGRLGQRQQTN